MSSSFPKYKVFAWLPGNYGTANYKSEWTTKAAAVRDYVRLKKSKTYGSGEVVNYLNDIVICKF
jgi:hypothetical protein